MLPVALLRSFTLAGRLVIAGHLQLCAIGMAWPTSLELYLPEDWATDERRRTAARIPSTVGFREKWRIALGHVRAVLHAGIAIEAVVADTAYGQIAQFRTGLGTPRPLVCARRPVLRQCAPHSRCAARVGCRDCERAGAVDVAASPVGPWHEGTTRRPLCRDSRSPIEEPRGAMVIVRRIAHRRPPEVLLQQSSAVDAAANLGHAGARPLACRDPISLKNELGLDHFECRSYPGWNHHAVLAAIPPSHVRSLPGTVGRALSGSVKALLL